MFTDEQVKKAFKEANRFDILEEFSGIHKIVQKGDNLYQISCWMIDHFSRIFANFSLKLKMVNSFLFLNIITENLEV